uniref:Synaptonemal complex protein 3 n=1 Tax=Xenopus tropicalis TaxID=8364 RepID=F6Y8Y3_XENTR
MAPRRRKAAAKSAKIVQEKKLTHSYKIQQKDLSGSEEDIKNDETPVIDKCRKKRPSSSLSNQGADNDYMGKALMAKRKRLETYTKASLKTSNQKIENVWKTQQDDRQKLSSEYSQQFGDLCQRWEADAQKAEEQDEKLTNMIRQQQKLFHQARIVQNQRLKTIRQDNEQFLKNMSDLEKTHENAQNELKKEMALLQKKIMMDTVKFSLASFLASIIMFWQLL